MSEYLCIDLKSFYASVECVELGLDPMTTDLVVADPARGKGTICLAVSPSLKAKGVKNRCRIYEIPEGMTYFTAPPRMQLYIDYSAHIHDIFLKYVSPSDMHVYSIDESFLDVTPYLHLYEMDARQLAGTIMKDIYDSMGLVSTCGIGTNLFLSKIALDIISKKAPDRIGYLNEELYRQKLWDHQPLTDFWMIGPGKQRRLQEKYGLYTMRDVAHFDEDVLYREFGIDAELLIDHAWGREPVRMSDIKNYHTKGHSLSNGQVLFRNYTAAETETVLKEMVQQCVLDLVRRHLVTDNVSIWVGYDHKVWSGFDGKSSSLGLSTANEGILIQAALRLFRACVKQNVPIRMIGVCFGNVIDESHEAYNLFTDYGEMDKDRRLQQTLLEIRKRFGDNSVIRLLSLLPEATGTERNNQIGGHQADYQIKLKYGDRRKEQKD
ncbi:MAG: DNA repair protein, partial [Erysipelotrichaceae bacterium]|nr:DNA repair protein [Erysipelotrichaceae bacterium]